MTVEEQLKTNLNAVMQDMFNLNSEGKIAGIVSTIILTNGQLRMQICFDPNTLTFGMLGCLEVAKATILSNNVKQEPEKLTTGYKQVVQ